MIFYFTSFDITDFKNKTDLEIMQPYVGTKSIALAQAQTMRYQIILDTMQWLHNAAQSLWYNAFWKHIMASFRI